MLPELLNQIPADQPIGKVTADGAYDTRPWLENTPGAQARNDTVRATRRLGRTIWRRWSGYHL